MAELQIVERREGDVTVLDLWGRITIGETSEALRGEITRLGEGGRNRILLHLGGVDRIDSSGLGNLVACCASVRRRGGDLKLVGLSGRLHDLMVMTKLLTVFDTYDDEGRALESFGPAAA